MWRVAAMFRGTRGYHEHEFDTEVEARNYSEKLALDAKCIHVSYCDIAQPNYPDGDFDAVTVKHFYNKEEQ